MIRAVANKRLELSDDEYSYFLSLKETFGESELKGVFSTDKNGIITSVSPPIDKQISLGMLFFLLNVMMNQKLRQFGSGLIDLKKNQQKVADINSAVNIVERLEELEKKVKIILETTRHG